MSKNDHGVWQEYTWARYLDEVLSFAAGLERRGVGRGDIVLVVGDNRPALYFGMLGVIALRAIPSPAYPDQPPEADRKSAVEGKSVSVRVDLGCSRIINKQKTHNTNEDKLYIL